MKKMDLAYCNECEDLVEFEIKKEMVEETYKGELVRFEFKVGRCLECGHEVASDIDYNSRKSEAKINAYKKKMGIISVDEISELLEKYDVGKEALADIAGFGKATIKRYFEGYIPAKSYSETLYLFLENENCFYHSVEQNKGKLKETAYKKIISRHAKLEEIDNSKLDQAANYIITKLGEVTPLALEKLLAFSHGVNYALNGIRLFSEECYVWQHGYVYPEIYFKYKKYKYNPIDCGIKSTHGCMLSKLTNEEIRAIDMVLNTFGLYSPKTLEKISHLQEPWLEKRVGYSEIEASNEIVNEESMKAYFEKNKLYSEDNIMLYIINILRCNS